MKLFLDTAELEHIEQALRTGLICGVTTNPTLLAQSLKDDTLEDRIKTISKRVRSDFSISVEVTSERYDEMVAQGMWFASWARQVTVKLPLTEDGLRACSYLKSKGISVNMTLCFSVSQALLASLAGADYVSIFLGRLDDLEGPGTGESVMKHVCQAIAPFRPATQLLAASLRSAEHVAQAIRSGCDIATIPFSVLKEMVQHPLTDQGLERFRQDSLVWADRFSTHFSREKK